MKIKQLLSKESRWTKRVFARDSKGYAVAPHSESATQFCLLGAAHRCYPNHEERRQALDKIILLLEKKGYNGSILLYNDSEIRTFSEIKQVLRAADV